jgi:hypothetical protein
MGLPGKNYPHSSVQTVLNLGDNGSPGIPGKNLVAFLNHFLKEALARMGMTGKQVRRGVRSYLKNLINSLFSQRFV